MGIAKKASPDSSRGPVLLARSLERRFGSRRALRSVDLELSAGEVGLVIGPNGAGKTTLLSLATGLSRPTRGSIEILGAQAPLEGAVRGRIGLVAHEPMVYADLSAAENLQFHLRTHGLGENQRVTRTNPQATPADPARKPVGVNEALAMVGLTAHADRRTAGFSRGMLQRLALARAFLHQPDLLLMDEPFTGLDEHAAATAEEMILRAKDGGAAVLLTTHDLERGARVADRVWMLNAGRVAWSAAAPLTGSELSAQLRALGKAA